MKFSNRWREKNSPPSPPPPREGVSSILFRSLDSGLETGSRTLSISRLCIRDIPFRGSFWFSYQFFFLLPAQVLAKWRMLNWNINGFYNSFNIFVLFKRNYKLTITRIFYKFDNLIKGNKQIYLITEIVNYLLIVVNFFLSSYIKQEKNNCLLAFRK